MGRYPETGVLIVENSPYRSSRPDVDRNRAFVEDLQHRGNYATSENSDRNTASDGDPGSALGVNW